MNFKPVTHVLFDLDGLLLSKLHKSLNDNFHPHVLLLDSEPIYEKVFADTVAKYDKEMTAEVRVKYLGTSERRACEICVADFQLPVSVDEFMRQAIELLHLLLKEVEFMPGAVRLVEHLAANNIPICVATGSNEDGVKIKTARYQDTFKLFHHIVKGTDPEVKKGKPAPDIFLIAASRFDQPANPENVNP